MGPLLHNRWCVSYPTSLLFPFPTLPPFFPFSCFCSSLSFSPLLFSFFLSSSFSPLLYSFYSIHSPTLFHLLPPSSIPHPGTYLLSGGEESVLVLWQLDTHKKQFRPRLGSPITRVACSPGDKYFTLSLQNNGRHMLCWHRNTCNV